MTIDIEPTDAFNGPATQLRVNDGHVHLGHGADFQYALLNAAGETVAPVARNALTPEQYAGWVGDDVYVVNCVAANLGLTPIVP